MIKRRRFEYLRETVRCCGMVETVLGQAEARQLGHCQMHEHLYVAATPASSKYPMLKIDDEARSGAELLDYRAAGGRAVLDAQPGGAGRGAAALARMSRLSGVEIIAVTGYHMPMFYSPGHWIFTEDGPALTDRFLREIREGIQGEEGVGIDLPIRAGAVKAAIGGEGPCGRLAVCLRAAARAAARAKVPLILHTESGIGAVEAVGLCEREGLAPARIAVCHVDRQAADFAPHEAVARTGVYMEYDTIARTKYHDDDAERGLILHMLSRGYGNRILLSLDTTADRLSSYGGSPGLGFILRCFLPSLYEAGVSGEEAHRMTVLNPMRIFENDAYR